MKILALDMSLTRTGWAVGAARVGLYTTGVIPAPGKEIKGVERIDKILRTVLELAEGKDLVVFEGYSFGSNMAYAREGAELRGVVCWALWRKGKTVMDIPPSNLKKYATGSDKKNANGDDKKIEVLKAAWDRLGYRGSDHNESDALWLLAMAKDHYGTMLAPVPAHNRGALDKVKWPKIAGY